MLKQQEEIDRLKAQLNQNVLHIPDPLQIAQSFNNTVSPHYKLSIYPFTSSIRSPLTPNLLCFNLL